MNYQEDAEAKASLHFFEATIPDMARHRGTKIVQDLLRHFPCEDFNDQGKPINAAPDTDIVMVCHSDDEKRSAYIKKHLDNDCQHFSQVIVVTNKESYGKERFEERFLPDGWREKLTLRVYNDKVPVENAGVMRYRCFHAAKSILRTENPDKQIVVIRDDRRPMFALKGPQKACQVSGSPKSINDAFKARIRNLINGGVIDGFSTQEFEGLKYGDVMTVPSQMATSSASVDEGMAWLKKNEAVKRGRKVNIGPKPRNTPSFDALNQCLIMTLQTHTYLMDRGICYPPGPVLEDYLFADLCHKANIRPRKTAAFSLRTKSGCDSIARLGDSAGAKLEIKDCWKGKGNVNNAYLASQMAAGLDFHYEGKTVIFTVGSDTQTFTFDDDPTSKQLGGGKYAVTAALLEMQRNKEYLRQCGKTTAGGSPTAKTIFEFSGTPPDNYVSGKGTFVTPNAPVQIERQASLARAVSGEKYLPQNMPCDRYHTGHLLPTINDDEKSDMEDTEKEISVTYSQGSATKIESLEMDSGDLSLVSDYKFPGGTFLAHGNGLEVMLQETGGTLLNTDRETGVRQNLVSRLNRVRKRDEPDSNPRPAKR